MKEQILHLRTLGKSYREIGLELKCSRSLISYYLNPHGKQKSLNRQLKNRFKRKYYYKMLLGGKCFNCGYNKCMDALQFHHINPATKKFMISEVIWHPNKTGNASEKEIEAEIKKCKLVCANCHYEIHSKNISMEEIGSTERI